HAASCARFAAHSLLPSRRSGRGRSDRDHLHQSDRQAHPRLHHGTLRLNRPRPSQKETSMTEHILKAFDEDLREISSSLAEMGGLAERLVAESVDALVKRDTALAQRVVAADAQVDQLQREIEEKAILTIARRQPMAVDLREVVSALRVANDLERVGDLAKNTAKRVLALDGEYHAQKQLRGVKHMSDMEIERLKQVLDAYGARDEQHALA